MLSNYGKIKLVNFIMKYLGNFGKTTYEREVIDGIEFALFIGSESVELHMDINGTKLMGGELMLHQCEWMTTLAIAYELVDTAEYRLQEYAMKKGA